MGNGPARLVAAVDETKQAGQIALVELERFAGHQRFEPGILEQRQDVRLGERQHDFPARGFGGLRPRGTLPGTLRHRQRIAVDGRAQPRLERRGNGVRPAPFALEGEQAPLVAREEGDQEANDQNPEHDRILAAAF